MSDKIGDEKLRLHSIYFVRVTASQTIKRPAPNSPRISDRTSESNPPGIIRKLDAEEYSEPVKVHFALSELMRWEKNQPSLCGIQSEIESILFKA